MIETTVNDESASYDRGVLGGVLDGDVICREELVEPHDTVDLGCSISVAHITSMMSHGGVGEVVMSGGEGIVVASSGESGSTVSEISKGVDVHSNRGIAANGTRNIGISSRRGLVPGEVAVHTSGDSRAGGRDDLARREEGSSSEGRSRVRLIKSHVLHTNHTTGQTGTRRANSRAIIGQVVQDNRATNDGEISAQSNQVEYLRLVDQTTNGQPVSKISSRARLTAAVGNVERVPVVSNSGRTGQVSELQ